MQTVCISYRCGSNDDNYNHGNDFSRAGLLAYERGGRFFRLVAIMAREGLTPKQQRFVDEYLIDFNATQAYKRAGYSAKTDVIASSNAIILLGNHKVAAAIDEKRAQLAQRLDLKQEDVLREIAKLAFANMADYMTVAPDGTAYLDLSTLTRDQAAAISELQCETYFEPGEEKGDTPKQVKKAKVKLTDKRAALESLGKHLGMFKDQIEHSGNITTKIEYVNDWKGRVATSDDD